MTRQAKKSYLESYRLQQIKIQRFYDLIGETPDKKDIFMVCIEKAKTLREKIEEQINAVDNSILSEILSQKYLCGKTLEEISYCLNYSLRQIERLHIKALENFSPC